MSTTRATALATCRPGRALVLLAVRGALAHDRCVDRRQQTTTVIGQSSSATTQATGVGILGGEREITVTRSPASPSRWPPAGGRSPTDRSPDPSGPERWSGTVWTAGGAPNRSASAASTSPMPRHPLAISIPLLFNDLPALLTLTAYTDGANSSQVTVALPGNIPPDPQTGVTIAFSSFSVLNGTGADFSNIGAFTLEIDGTGAAGLDVEIGAVVTEPVPEPRTAFLLGVAWSDGAARESASLRQPNSRSGSGIAVGCSGARGEPRVRRATGVPGGGDRRVEGLL